MVQTPTPPVTMVRKMALVAYLVLLTYAGWCFFSLILILMLAIYLGAVYKTGFQNDLDLNMPITNFTEEDLNLPLRQFLLDNSGVTLEDIRANVCCLYMLAISLALYGYPQWSGCRMLQRGLDLGRNSRQAYRFIQRHQIIQRVICLLELLAMIWFNIRFLLWDELITTAGYVTNFIMVFIILCRMQCLGVVDKFAHELLNDIRGDSDASGQFKYKRMGGNEEKKVEKKKEENQEKKVGPAKIDFFNIV